MTSVATEPTPSANVAEGVVVPLPTAETQYGTRRILDLDSRFDEDGSTITDLAAASAVFDRAMPAVLSFAEGLRQSRGATRDFMLASFQLRTFCRTQEGNIDWAGKTTAYKVLWSNRVSSILRLSGMNKSEVDAFNAAIRRYNSDNDALRRFMTDFLAKSDDKLAKSITVLEDGTVKIGGDMATALRKEAGKQKTASGKAVQGFEQATFAKSGETVGLPKARQKKEEESSDKGSNEPSAKWDQMRAEVVRRDDKGTLHLATEAVADSLHHLLSDAAVTIVGAPGAKIKLPARKALANGEGWLPIWQQIADLAAAVVKIAEEPEKADKATDLAPYLWKEGK